MSGASNVKVFKLNGNKELSQLRLTPTGKISSAKTRVYAQRYRKDWEQHPDFQGWLKSVPNCPTRAYCLYCKRDLHAHRLSLLKHTSTLKHQRAALAKHGNVNAQAVNTTNIKYIETDDDQEREFYTNVEYLDGEFHQVEKLSMDDIVLGFEARTEGSLNEAEDQLAVNTIENERDGEKRDTLSEAMKHIQSEDEEEQAAIMMVDCTDEQLTEKEMLQNDEPNENHLTRHLVLDSEMFNNLQKEVIIVKPEVDPSKMILKKIVMKPETILPSSKIVTLQSIKTEPGAKVVSNSMRKGVVANMTVIPKEVITKRSRITTHVIDTNKGNPIAGLQVSLYKLVDGRWTFINESSTTNTGYCNDLLENRKTSFSTGRYKLHFDTEKYYTSHRIETLFPFVEIVFDMKSANTVCHMPLLLSPYCYTVHRGCNNSTL